MSTAQLAHVLIFSKSLPSQVNFYCAALGLKAQPSSEAGYVLLAAGDRVQVAIHAILETIAQDITIATPPQWRGDAASKACFEADNLDACRRAVLKHGGGAKDPWAWNGATYCDCVDPEGNVFQLRQGPRATPEQSAPGQ